MSEIKEKCVGEKIVLFPPAGKKFCTIRLTIFFIVNPDYKKAVTLDEEELSHIIITSSIFEKFMLEECTREKW
jgi:hypothetical protein